MHFEARERFPAFCAAVANGPSRPFGTCPDAAERFPRAADHLQRSILTLERSAVRTNRPDATAAKNALSTNDPDRTIKQTPRQHSETSPKKSFATRSTDRVALDCGSHAAWIPINESMYGPRRHRGMGSQNDVKLAADVADRLSEGCSPERIAGRLRFGIESGLCRALGLICVKA